jgi:hypothetical protein
MQACNDFSSDIRVDKVFRNFEMFSKDIQFFIASDETDKRDGPVRDVINFRECEFWGRQNGTIPTLLDKLGRCFTLEAAVTMVLVVKELKVLGLGSELAITPKPLPSKKLPVVSVIEALHNAVAPGFSNRDEDHLDVQRKTKPEDDAKGTRVTIASAETEFVVDLEEVRDSHSLPTADQAQSHSLVVFSPLGVDKDAMTVEIHDVKRIEAAIVFDVSGAHEVRLMDIVEA